ncbi:MAG: OmpH family outer membrane protein [Bacteroidia bacterium]
MKKIVLVLSVLILSTSLVKSQTKIGYVNSEAVLKLLVDKSDNSKKFEDFQKALVQQQNDLIADFNEKVEKFNKDSATFKSDYKEIKRTEIVDLYNKTQTFKNEMQQKVQTKQQEFLKPLATKAIEIIKEVAKEHGYIYILEQSNLIVSPPGDDILELVKKKMKG